MDLDLVGRLQQQISLRALFKQFASAWQEFASDSVEKCSTSLQFDWRLFRQALHALIRTLRAITDHIALLLKHPDSQATLSLVYLNEIVDSDSAYDSVLSWLEEDTLNAVSAAIVSDLQSHRDMGASFPVSSFIDCLPDLEFGRVEHALSVDGNAVVSLPKKELADSVQAFILTIESESAAFYQIVLEHARRLTPKRRIDEDEDEEGLLHPRRRG
ncbi:hypothetical protein JAAARDRAFT_258791 [Jaapia argillacea MUCL 33604]|uniref:Uncharacterized protein n=1 Tax=Jaapia argillacea MUCL 33604 TaxID=933084 RepID=A0A067PWA5_9AGAM|nr:hypothetical protein JAAARDRAFT_258791 [Jaapia argillacea MUCL 33604]